MNAFGMRVIESAHAYTLERARTYPKRKAKSPRHWARMDKKYAKRYGMRVVPQCYQMGDTFIVHPSLMPEIRRATREADAAGRNPWV